MLYLFYFLLQCRNILVFHPLTEKQRVCPGTKFIYQNILPLHGLNILWQIVQNIIVDSGPYHSQQGGN